MIQLAEELASTFSRGVGARLPEGEFNRLALGVFRYQYERNRPYAAYCRARGRAPESVTAWQDIPALATDAFKEAELTTVPRDEVRVVYLTSGTTGGGERAGRHLLPDTDLYDASLLPNFRAHVLPDVDAIRIHVLGPTHRYNPHSSLGHMNSRVQEAFGLPGSEVFWTDEGPRFGCLASALEKAEGEGVPVCLLGTAFGFVHFLDWLDGERRGDFRLPPGSRIMDTGGYKGRSREVPRVELYALYGERLGVPFSHVVNEYGMTELGSQFYDTVLRDGESGDGPRVKSVPPWVRVLVVDPETLEPLPTGTVGLLRFFDLANMHTVAAIQTDDVGVQVGEGFEILGRTADAQPRGCSLAADDLAASRNDRLVGVTEIL